MMTLTEIGSLVEKSEFETLENIFGKLKKENNILFKQTIEKLKIIFINSNAVNILNKIAMIFNIYLVHSSAPIIISKIISGIYENCAGTLLFAINGLKSHHLKDELKMLWLKNISFEM